MREFVIRHVEKIDAPQLRSIDQASPEVRSVRQRIDPRPDVDFLSFLRSGGHPQASCYLAIDPETERIAGFALTDVERVTLNGGLVDAAYMFHIRVHPDYRRQGVGRKLVAYGEELGRSRGARLFWMALVQGNEPSRRLMEGSGYRWAARIGYRAVPTIAGRLPLLPGGGNLTVRQAVVVDEHSITSLESHFWTPHQLWKRRAYPLATTAYVAVGRAGRVEAFANCFEQYLVADNRFLGFAGLPRRANALLLPAATRSASRLVFLRDLAFSHPAAAERLVSWLLLRYRQRADMVVVGADVKSLDYELLARLPGIGGHVDLMVKPEGISPHPTRPFHMVLG